MSGSDGVELVQDSPPVREWPRQGWLEAAARMAAAGDDRLLIPDVVEDDVDVEWE